MAAPAANNSAQSVGEPDFPLSNVPEQDESGDAEPPNFREKEQDRSPLVKPPANMPELKDWFGDNEQNLSKRESDPITPGSARERRFRRDTEDGETPSRSTFRSTLSQPSQMGNFKHHSLRNSDRDRDKDGEKDREREMRDKEGQDRLRHLADKYDRDRLALPLTGLRSKERDVAPHLASGSASRVTAQGQVPSAGSRRAEPREANKKKVVEASEDWRRGTDSRSARDERSEVTRRERDERERPRSRVRDSSRSRRESSTSRRDHRDDARRERDRDLDRENDEDPRRWRDDGKRDERIAARRGERPSEPYKERDRVQGKESTWDTTSERRWIPVEERDGRSKRNPGRDKKAAVGVDEGKERDDRRDRDRDREKEPAWMDTYIPNTMGTGILGGKSGEGELDGIQAWKKEQKEKELRDQTSPLITNTENSKRQESVEKVNANTKQLDEIQLFKLMMKREEEKKKNDFANGPSLINASVDQSDSPTQHAAAAFADHPTKTPPSAPGNPSSPLLQPESHSSVTAPLSLLSILGSKERPPPVNSPATLDTVGDAMRTIPSSKLMDSSLRENSPLTTQNTGRPGVESGPPQGSRLLAFGRTPSVTAKSQVLNMNRGAVQNGQFQGSPDPNQQPLPSSDPLHTLPWFSPIEDQQRSSLGADGQKDISLSDTHHQSQVERASVIQTIDHGSLQDATPSVDNGSGFHIGKGSRFAKFFDGKTRENGSSMIKPHIPGNVHSSPGPGGQRQELGGFEGNLAGSPDPRALDEIYLMLNNSAHGTRGAPAHIPASTLPHNGSFNLQGQDNSHLLHQHLQQPHQQMHGSRLEPLYESRLDDRNFVPDGMVPGLRSAPSRNREPSGIYPGALEDGMHFNPQRIHGQRALEHIYSGVPPSLYSQPVARNGNVSLQQTQYRGGPSPIPHQQNILPSAQPQRLPPGLANLGGRPPHEPSQFLGMPGIPSHGLLNVNGSQPFSNFPPGGPSFGGLQLRAPNQLQHSGGHLSATHPNNIDPRTVSQNQFLGAAGGGGLRGVGNGFTVPPGPPGHIPSPLLAMRQQQQHLHPYMVQQHLPPMQQHGVSQPAQDLMALLMGGSRRE